MEKKGEEERSEKERKGGLTIKAKQRQTRETLWKKMEKRREVKRREKGG